MVDSIEYNEVNKKGILPSYEMDSLPCYPRQSELYTQVVGYDQQHDSGGVAYTVAAGKILHLCTLTAHLDNRGAATASGGSFLRNDGDVAIYNILYGTVQAETTKSLNVTFNPPLQLLESYYIYNVSTAAALYANISWFGFLE